MLRRGIPFFQRLQSLHVRALENEVILILRPNGIAAGFKNLAVLIVRLTAKHHVLHVVFLDVGFIGGMIPSGRRAL